MKKISAFFIAVVMLLALCSCGSEATEPDMVFPTDNGSEETDITNETETNNMENNISENFVLILGGTFQMGSPEDEAWRSQDETQHTVTVSDFYMSIYELTQAEYQEIMGDNPSSFSGDDLPVENISWLDAVHYCNARSEKEGLTPVYSIDGQSVTWDRSANGYRLPTEAEWEYACRAGTTTPFNTETSISAEECNSKGIAEEIQAQTGADLFEITLVNPYSMDYNTVLDEAQRDQNAQARPELATHVEIWRSMIRSFLATPTGLRTTI